MNHDDERDHIEERANDSIEQFDSDALDMRCESCGKVERTTCDADIRDFIDHVCINGKPCADSGNVTVANARLYPLL